MSSSLRSSGQGSDHSVYVADFPFHWGEVQLEELFGQRPGRRIRIIKDPLTGMGQGFGFVSMINRSEAEGFIRRWHGDIVLGRPLRVDWDKSTHAKSGIRNSGGGGDNDSDRRPIKTSRS